MGDPMRRRTLLQFGTAALCGALLPRAARSQAGYPDRAIRLIVPFPPGGAFDTIGRPWAERIKSLLGTMVIENIGGAGGGVGAAQAARSRPDGYTLLLGGATTHITEALLKTRPTFDPLKDLEGVEIGTVGRAGVGSGGMVTKVQAARIAAAGGVPAPSIRCTSGPNRFIRTAAAASAGW